MPNIASGQLPERLQQAIEEGRITREQVEERIRQRQQAQGGQPGGQLGQVSTVTQEDVQLREGLTVTVSIQVVERTDVLVVPNRAITRQGGETLIRVMKDGVAEERAVETGISNFTHTEITGGLSEGEEIVVSQPTTSASSTTTQGQGRSPIRLFGPPRR